VGQAGLDGGRRAYRVKAVLGERRGPQLRLADGVEYLAVSARADNVRIYDDDPHLWIRTVQKLERIKEMNRAISMP